MSRACAFAMTVLGITSCADSTAPDDPMICMYGTPTGSFEIKGAVTAEGSDAPVGDAVITLKSSQEGLLLLPPAETDTKGEYRLEGIGFPAEKVRVVCTPPEESGLDADSTDVELKFIKDDKTESVWYLGNAKSTVNFKLKAKKTED